MAKQGAIEMEGTVAEVLPNATFRVTVNGGHDVLTTLGGKMRQNRIVIARQGRGQLAVRIVALVVTSILTLGALVASSLLIAGPR